MFQFGSEDSDMPLLFKQFTLSYVCCIKLYQGHSTTIDKNVLTVYISNLQTGDVRRSVAHASFCIEILN